MDHFLPAVTYQEYKWLICGDVKVVGQVLELYGGHAKYPCFLCLWDSWFEDKHYVWQKWPLRQVLKPRSHNGQSNSLVEPNKILLPPLHIKLGLMMNFMKAMNAEDNGFAFLQEKFPQISMERLKARIFDGPQIRELMTDPLFDGELSEAKPSAWQSLKSVGTNCQENPRRVKYEKDIVELFKSFRNFGQRMSVKLHFLRSHLNDFQKNCGYLSEE